MRTIYFLTLEPTPESELHIQGDRLQENTGVGISEVEVEVVVYGTVGKVGKSFF